MALRTMMLLLLMVLPFSCMSVGTSASAGLNLVLYPNAAWGGEVRVSFLSIRRFAPHSNPRALTHGQSTWSKPVADPRRVRPQATVNKTIAQLDETTLEFAGSAPFSVEITGTLTPPADLVGDGKQVQLSCEILNGAGFLWLDDHVICQGGHDPTQWGQYKSDALVLPWMVAPGIPLGGSVTKPLFLRATFAHLDRADMHGKPSFTLKWGALPPISPPGPPSPPYPPPAYVGCFQDAHSVGPSMCNRTSGICPRDLPFNAGDLKGGVGKNTDSPSACAQECRTKMGGHMPKYIGLQDGDNCFCGNNYGQYGKASNCNMRKSSTRRTATPHSNLISRDISDGFLCCSLPVSRTENHVRRLRYQLGLRHACTGAAASAAGAAGCSSAGVCVHDGRPAHAVAASVDAAQPAPWALGYIREGQLCRPRSATARCAH